MASSPPLPVHSIDKANVLATSRLWRKTVTDLVAKDYPEIQLDHQLVDSAAMVMVSNPRKLNGVILTENMFGDMCVPAVHDAQALSSSLTWPSSFSIHSLSDESSVIPGSLGLLPSASLAGVPSSSKTTMGLYEPIHGSAPDIAGQDIANPIGTILSAAMMLEYSLGRPKEAGLIKQAVKDVLDADLRTRDLGGKSGTKEMGDSIVAALEKLL
jgi:3-isopropylmalate dehydrogenase